MLPVNIRYKAEVSGTSNLCIAIAKRVADEMETRNLEASSLFVSKLGLMIQWRSEFNQGRIADIEINNDGYVNGFTNAYQGYESLSWIVSDFPFIGTFKAPDLKMTLAESLEYIRHFIWANHNT